MLVFGLRLRGGPVKSDFDGIIPALSRSTEPRYPQENGKDRPRDKPVTKKNPTLFVISDQRPASTPTATRKRDSYKELKERTRPTENLKAKLPSFSGIHAAGK